MVGVSFSGSWYLIAMLWFSRSVVCYLDFTGAEERYYRFGSFAPERTSAAKWFVDGKDYMSAVADAIVAAKHEIFITDWQMNPHIFMKRPDTGMTSLEWRLDQMLLRKAKDVRIYILRPRTTQ